MTKHYCIFMAIPLLIAILVASPTITISATLPTPTATTPAAAPEANSSSPAAALPVYDTTPTAYEMLSQYKLAPGILPEGVTGYVLNPDGSFQVYLPADCNLRAGGMNVRYSSVIMGNLQSQSISDLQGVNVKELFMWIGITKVEASDGQLHFIAGPISKSFPMDKFSNSPQCN